MSIPVYGTEQPEFHLTKCDCVVKDKVYKAPEMVCKLCGLWFGGVPRCLAWDQNRRWIHDQTCNCGSFPTTPNIEFPIRGVSLHDLDELRNTEPTTMTIEDEKDFFAFMNNGHKRPDGQ